VASSYHHQSLKHPTMPCVVQASLSSSDTDGSSLGSEDNLTLPVADAMHRMKNVKYKEKENVLPALASKLDAVIHARRKEVSFAKGAGLNRVLDQKNRIVAKIAASEEYRPEAQALVPKKVPYSMNRSAPLYYGASISLESLSKGHFLTVCWQDGEVITENLQTAQKGDVVVFNILDLGQLDSYRPLRFGDSLWLQVVPGNGELRWQNGSVLGSKVEHARVLPTVPLDPSLESKEQGPPTDNLIVGKPTPVKAALPRNKEEKIDEKHARERNHRAFSLGRWVIRPSNEKLARRGGVVCNYDEVFLEQDQSYISEGSSMNKDGHHVKRVVLRQLPSRQQLKDIQQSQGLLVDRHGVFRIRITEMDSLMEGMSQEERRNELRMRKAKRNLKWSTACRNGYRVYTKHR
jgi:hypothetical protein